VPGARGTWQSSALLNTQTLEHEPVVFPGHLELAVVDSGQRHDHASGDYRVRRGLDRNMRVAAIVILTQQGEAARVARETLEASVPHLEARIIVP